MARFSSKAIITAERRSAQYNRKRPRDIYSWKDPFPSVSGTVPEKMVFARLMIMRIPFQFQSFTTVNIPELRILKDYRPDFIIPSAKLIIEVQGSYWHSQPEQIDSDSFKFALYELMGYKVLSWWDYEIQTNLDALFAAEPLLNRWTGPRGSRIITSKQSYRDDLKGLRTRNQRHYVGGRQPATSRRAIRKAQSKYAT